MRGSFGSSGTARTGSTAEPSAQALHAPGTGPLPTLLKKLDAAPLGPALEAGVAQVIADRGARSRAFFERNGEAFEASQDLIALPDRYLPVLTGGSRRGAPRPWRLVQDSASFCPRCWAASTRCGPWIARKRCSADAHSA